ncbi:hypothetical protein [Clostridium sp. HBUAS56010]|uniref:hypothetical protein n=1 Tax=Clostridium sp. HBUAS56010 TaxID=2571127 RepID=UPI0011788385|nr:hypothetical protein [Clostridium sp. HBUAS56010]
MILGFSFAASKESFNISPVSPENIEYLTIKSAIYDEAYFSEDIINVDDFDGNIPSEWTFNTRLHAYFKGNLHGGNVNFTENIVEYIRIKRKTAYDNKFKTIYEKKIESKEDFIVDIMHYYAPVGTVSFAYVPVISGGENDYIISTIESKFDSYFICEKDVSYPMILDTDFNKRRIQRTGTIEPLGRKTPIIFKGGLTNYYAGDIKCCFIENTDCNWQTETSWKYRNIIYDFLTNGNVKILKDYFGNVWMIGVTSDEISEESDHPLHVITKFSVAECGDAYSTNDLYYNGLLNTNIDG